MKKFMAKKTAIPLLLCLASPLVSARETNLKDAVLANKLTDDTIVSLALNEKLGECKAYKNAVGSFYYTLTSKYVVQGREIPAFSQQVGPKTQNVRNRTGAEIIKYLKGDCDDFLAGQGEIIESPQAAIAAKSELSTKIRRLMANGFCGAPTLKHQSVKFKEAQVSDVEFFQKDKGIVCRSKVVRSRVFDINKCDTTEQEAYLPEKICTVLYQSARGNKGDRSDTTSAAKKKDLRWSALEKAPIMELSAEDQHKLAMNQLATQYPGIADNTNASMTADQFLMGELVGVITSTVDFANIDANVLYSKLVGFLGTATCIGKNPSTLPQFSPSLQGLVPSLPRVLVHSKKDELTQSLAAQRAAAGETSSGTPSDLDLLVHMIELFDKEETPLQYTIYEVPTLTQIASMQAQFASSTGRVCQTSPQMNLNTGKNYGSSNETANSGQAHTQTASIPNNEGPNAGGRRTASPAPMNGSKFNKAPEPIYSLDTSKVQAKISSVKTKSLFLAPGAEVINPDITGAAGAAARTRTR